MVDRKYLDNLRKLTKMKEVSHESLAEAIGKERSVLTKKLNGHIPITVDEYLALVSHLETDLFSLLLAQTDDDLREIAMSGSIRVKHPETEIPELLKRFKERYLAYIEEDKKQVFSYLVEQLLQLFPPVSGPK